MFETHLTVVGRIVTDLRRRIVNNQELISFRVASNSRRRTGDGTWEPGNTLFITVNCWGRLVTGVGAALYKGAPVIVVGDVFTSEYEDREGVKRASLEMRATTVGPDLSRCIARIEQPQPKPADPVAHHFEAGGEAGGEAGADAGVDAGEPGETADLALSA